MSKIEKMASATQTTLKMRPLSALFSADSSPKEDVPAFATATSIKPRMPLSGCFSDDLWPKEDTATGDSPPRSETEDITQQIAKLVRKLGIESLEGNRVAAKLTPSQVTTVLLRLQSKAELSLLFFKWIRMQQCFSHTTYTYCTMISILMETKIYRPAEELVKDVAVDCARDSLSNIVETLVKVCSERKFKTLGEVLDLLWRTYANAGMIEEAHETFQRMKVLGLKPNCRSCNKFLVALRKANKAEFALGFFS